MAAVYTDSMECLKTLTVQLPQKPSKDHGCSRYLITCRVVRTILEILGIQSSVPKEGCVPTQKKNEDFPRWRWGYRFLPFKSHQKQAGNKLWCKNQAKRTTPCHALSLRASLIADRSTSTQASKAVWHQSSFCVLCFAFLCLLSSVLEHPWNGHCSLLTGLHRSTASRFLRGPVGS